MRKRECEENNDRNVTVYCVCIYVHVHTYMILPHLIFICQPAIIIIVHHTVSVPWCTCVMTYYLLNIVLYAIW